MYSYAVVVEYFGLGLFIGFMGWGFSRIATMYGRFLH